MVSDTTLIDLIPQTVQNYNDDGTLKERQFFRSHPKKKTKAVVKKAVKKPGKKNQK